MFVFNKTVQATYRIRKKTQLFAKPPKSEIQTTHGPKIHPVKMSFQRILTS